MWSEASRLQSQPACKNERYTEMAFDDLIARINMLFTEAENRPEDAHELLEYIHQELNQFRATGQPLPEDLVEFEQRLERELGNVSTETDG